MKNNTDTEDDYVNKLVKHLGKNLKVEKEVWSDCGNGRVDLVVTTTEGYNFGIECKKNNSKRGEEMGEFVKQAIRYVGYKFKGKRIPIFISPPISYNYFLLNEFSQDIEGKMWHKDRHELHTNHHSFNGFLGCFGVGEIRKSKDSWGKEYFYFSTSNKIIWSSENKKIWDYPKYEIKMAGTHIKNYNLLIKKLAI